ncbi:MAG TPA: hypothetical protein VJR93_04740 [Chthoniobacterales bacterium]|nr:hypothetical protein [Chthoniobacterales bacterium]
MAKKPLGKDRVFLAIMGKTGLCWNVILITWFGIAAESNRRAAFQNESIFVAR